MLTGLEMPPIESSVSSSGAVAGGIGIASL